MDKRRIQEVLGLMTKNLECSICLDLLRNPISTKCGHQFCRFCLVQFLKNKRSVPCPLCKKPVTERSLLDREELAKIVKHVRDLITSFQEESGDIFTPPKGPARQYFTPSTPELLKSKYNIRQTKCNVINRKQTVEFTNLSKSPTNVNNNKDEVRNDDVLQVTRSSKRRTTSSTVNTRSKLRKSKDGAEESTGNTTTPPSNKRLKQHHATSLNTTTDLTTTSCVKMDDKAESVSVNNLVCSIEIDDSNEETPNSATTKITETQTKNIKCNYAISCSTSSVCTNSMMSNVNEEFLTYLNNGSLGANTNSATFVNFDSAACQLVTDVPDLKTTTCEFVSNSHKYCLSETMDMDSLKIANKSVHKREITRTIENLQTHELAPKDKSLRNSNRLISKNVKNGDSASKIELIHSTTDAKHKSSNTNIDNSVNKLSAKESVSESAVLQRELNITDNNKYPQEKIDTDNQCVKSTQNTSESYDVNFFDSQSKDPNRNKPTFGKTNPPLRTSDRVNKNKILTKCIQSPDISVLTQGGVKTPQFVTRTYSRSQIKSLVTKVKDAANWSKVVPELNQFEWSPDGDLETEADIETVAESGIVQKEVLNLESDVSMESAFGFNSKSLVVTQDKCQGFVSKQLIPVSTATSFTLPYNDKELNWSPETEHSSALCIKDLLATPSISEHNKNNISTLSSIYESASSKTNPLTVKNSGVKTTPLKYGRGRIILNYSNNSLDSSLLVKSTKISADYIPKHTSNNRKLRVKLDTRGKLHMSLENKNTESTKLKVLKMVNNTHNVIATKNLDPYEFHSSQTPKAQKKKPLAQKHSSKKSNRLALLGKKASLEIINDRKENNRNKGKLTVTFADTEPIVIDIANNNIFSNSSLNLNQNNLVECSSDNLHSDITFNAGNLVDITSSNSNSCEHIPVDITCIADSVDEDEPTIAPSRTNSDKSRQAHACIQLEKETGDINKITSISVTGKTNRKSDCERRDGVSLIEANNARNNRPAKTLIKPDSVKPSENDKDLYDESTCSKEINYRFKKQKICNKKLKSKRQHQSDCKKNKDEIHKLIQQINNAEGHCFMFSTQEAYSSMEYVNNTPNVDHTTNCTKDGGTSIESGAPFDIVHSDEGDQHLIYHSDVDGAHCRIHTDHVQNITAGGVKNDENLSEENVPTDNSDGVDCNDVINVMADSFRDDTLQATQKEDRSNGPNLSNLYGEQPANQANSVVIADDVPQIPHVGSIESGFRHLNNEILDDVANVNLFSYVMDGVIAGTNKLIKKDTGDVKLDNESKIDYAMDEILPEVLTNIEDQQDFEEQIDCLKLKESMVDDDLNKSDTQNIGKENYHSSEVPTGLDILKNKINDNQNTEISKKFKNKLRKNYFHDSKNVTTDEIYALPLSIISPTQSKNITPHSMSSYIVKSRRNQIQKKIVEKDCTESLNCRKIRLTSLDIRLSQANPVNIISGLTKISTNKCDKLEDGSKKNEFDMSINDDDNCPRNTSQSKTYSSLELGLAEVPSTDFVNSSEQNFSSFSKSTKNTKQDVESCENAEFSTNKSDNEQAIPSKPKSHRTRSSHALSRFNDGSLDSSVEENFVSCIPPTPLKDIEINAFQESLLLEEENILEATYDRPPSQDSSDTDDLNIKVEETQYEIPKLVSNKNERSQVKKIRKRFVRKKSKTVDKKISLENNLKIISDSEDDIGLKSCQKSKSTDCSKSEPLISVEVSVTQSSTLPCSMPSQYINDVIASTTFNNNIVNSSTNKLVLPSSQSSVSTGQESESVLKNYTVNNPVDFSNDSNQSHQSSCDRPITVSRKHSKVSSQEDKENGGSQKVVSNNVSIIEKNLIPQEVHQMTSSLKRKRTFSSMSSSKKRLSSTATPSLANSCKSVHSKNKCSVNKNTEGSKCFDSSEDELVIKLSKRKCFTLEGSPPSIDKSSKSSQSETGLCVNFVTAPHLPLESSKCLTSSASFKFSNSQSKSNKPLDSLSKSDNFKEADVDNIQNTHSDSHMSFSGSSSSIVKKKHSLFTKSDNKITGCSMKNSQFISSDQTHSHDQTPKIFQCDNPLVNHKINSKGNMFSKELQSTTDAIGDTEDEYVESLVSGNQDEQLAIENAETMPPSGLPTECLQPQHEESSDSEFNLPESEHDLTDDDHKVIKDTFENDEKVKYPSEDEADDMYADLPYTSSPIMATGRSLKSVRSDEELTSDHEDELIYRIRKKRTVVIESDEDDNCDAEESSVHTCLNSSSAFSSQGDVTTQQRGDMATNIDNMRQEIMKLEGELADKTTRVILDSENVEDEHLRHGQQKNVNIIRSSPDIEDPNSDDSSSDFFLSPVQYSPPLSDQPHSKDVLGPAREMVVDSMRKDDEESDLNVEMSENLKANDKGLRQLIETPDIPEEVRKAMEILQKYKMELQYSQNSPLSTKHPQKSTALSESVCKPSCNNSSFTEKYKNSTPGKISLQSIESTLMDITPNRRSVNKDKNRSEMNSNGSTPIQKVQINSRKTTPANSRKIVCNKDNLSPMDSNITSTSNTFSRSVRFNFASSGLAKNQTIKVQTLAEINDAKFYSKFNKHITHLIVKTESAESRACERTLKFFQGVANRCWILSYCWIEESLKAGHMLLEDSYEITGDTVTGSTHNGPRRSRLSDEMLFSGLTVTCVGVSAEMSKVNMINLLEACGATYVQDVNMLAAVNDTSMCLIICCSDTEEKKPSAIENDFYISKYRNYGLVTVAREWVLDSIGTFQHQPMKDYLLTPTLVKLPF